MVLQALRTIGMSYKELCTKSAVQCRLKPAQLLLNNGMFCKCPLVSHLLNRSMCFYGITLGDCHSLVCKKNDPIENKLRSWGQKVWVL